MVTLLRRSLHYVALVAMVVMAFLPGCTIEPPLHLAETTAVDISMPEIVCDIDLIWDIDPDWRDTWYYGWDETDDRLFGPLDYPEPSNYEARVYYIGDDPDARWSKLDRHTFWGKSFSRRFAFGYHDLLLWSNIDSDDGTQVLRVIESDPDNVVATTSTTSLNYGLPAPSRGPVHNNPEIFYSALVDNFLVSKNPADYDYFDEERNVWVKHVETKLYPLVYTYLVQVILYHNNNRVTGTGDRSVVTSMAQAVSLHSGRTSPKDVVVTYEMRMKRGLKAAGNRDADILGGKLTTFGLCDMEPWGRSRSTRYSGSRADLRNHVMVNLTFSNNTDSVYMFDVTDQLQRQAHGGVVTVELDVDTLTIPISGTSHGTFQPVIVDGDSIVYEFEM